MPWPTRRDASPAASEAETARQEFEGEADKSELIGFPEPHVSQPQACLIFVCSRSGTTNLIGRFSVDMWPGAVRSFARTEYAACPAFPKASEKIAFVREFTFRLNHRQLSHMTKTAKFGPVGFEPAPITSTQKSWTPDRDRGLERTWQ